MVDFGYTLSPSTIIDLDRDRPPFFDKILEVQPDITKCIACGSCTASCSAGNFTETSLRKFILLIDRGLEEKAKNMIQSCMLCGKCKIVCPRGLNTRDIILMANELLKERGI